MLDAISALKRVLAGEDTMARAVGIHEAAKFVKAANEHIRKIADAESAQVVTRKRIITL